jgi:hypothetical protein
MRAFVLALIVVLVALADMAAAAFPTARYRKPVGFGPHGDVRPLFKKHHKQNPPFRANPLPNDMPDKKSKSRSYHFKYGPIFPEHHQHLELSAQAWWPKDHQLYY